MIPIPTTSTIVETLQKDLRSQLDLSDDDLRKVANAFASVVGAQVKLVYLAVLDIQRNLYPDTADLAENGGQLERLGMIYLNRGINPATAGVYTVAVTGEVGASIKANLTFKSNDDSTSPGELFITDSETILTGANDTVSIRSLSGGIDFSLQVGDQLTITEPVIGVEQVVEVTAIEEAPFDAESTDAYRQAIEDAIQLEPQGGAKTDYRLWADDVQGVREVYPYVKDGEAGTVQVYVESTDNQGVPNQAILDEVLEVIEFDPDETKPTNERGRRPIQAIIEVLPVVLVPVDVTITGLVTNTTEIQAAINTNIESYLLNIRPYIAGADLPRNQNDILFSSRLSGVVTDVLDVDNFFSDFVMEVNGNAVSTFQFSRENIPYLRTLNFS